MWKKIRSAHGILRDEGTLSLIANLRRRAARNLAGNTLSNLFPVMAHYTHSDGTRSPLYAGYRDFMKPLHCLAHTDSQGYKLFWRDNAADYLGKPRLGGALQFQRFITHELKVDITGKTILDVGCGDGALAYVLVAHGAGKVDGIDVDFSYRQLNPQHETLLKEAVSNLPAMASKKITDVEKQISIFEGDIQNLQVDGRYDIILSLTVLEHIIDLRAGIQAMSDLLKPGGLMIHRINPYFSEMGGHEFGILDFPWGHVRLDRDEIAEYLATYRAWEKEQALEVLQEGFNDPKLSLEEIDAMFQSLGLSLLHGSESRAFSWKPDTSPEVILSQCRRIYPTIAWRDLISDNVVRVLRKN